MNFVFSSGLKKKKMSNKKIWTRSGKRGRMDLEVEQVVLIFSALSRCCPNKLLLSTWRSWTHFKMAVGISQRGSA